MCSIRIRYISVNVPKTEFHFSFYFISFFLLLKNFYPLTLYVEYILFFFFLSFSVNAGKEGISTVAVKTLKENATEIERNDLYSELHVS